MTAYLHCISIYYVDNCEFWTCSQVCASAETILGYNVYKIDTTRKSVIYKNLALTKLGI